MGKRAEVSAIAMDPNHKVPVVLLKIEDDERFIPIWIGLMEASAILVALEGTEVQRPMTHDLLCNIARVCGQVVKRIEVCDLRDGTYYAEMTVQDGDHVHVIDCRPSDAIAIALRTSAPIWVHDRVLDKVQIEDQPEVEEASEDVIEAPAAEEAEEEEGRTPQPAPAVVDGFDTDEEKMREILEDLSPDDFKYKM